VRVLVVDDDFGSRMVAEATVQALGHTCLTAEDGDQAWRSIRESAPDVVVSDRAMPGMDGLELCRRIRAMSADSYIYIVLVTSLSNPVDVLEGMHAGADDYIGKPLHPFDLETRLLAARRVTELHAELARTRAELRRQASTDPLTGLRNRLTLDGDLQQLHAVSERYGRSYSLALCDVDNFKGYNDTYGHPAGDAVLRQIATAMVASVRTVDRVYRYGGEEFLIVLPEQPATPAHLVLERVLGAVRALRIVHDASGATNVVTLSAGVASCTPERRISGATLLTEADHALYRAKTNGRDQVTHSVPAG
jgi:diguanylate cyclase (GGDEF)-like protein